MPFQGLTALTLNIKILKLWNMVKVCTHEHTAMWHLHCTATRLLQYTLAAWQAAERAETESYVITGKRTDLNCRLFWNLFVKEYLSLSLSISLNPPPLSLYIYIYLSKSRSLSLSLSLQPKISIAQLTLANAPLPVRVTNFDMTEVPDPLPSFPRPMYSRQLLEFPHI